MKMKRKMPKEKRNQLILVVIATMAVLGGLGFGLLKAQYDNLSRYERRHLLAEAELKKMQEAVKREEMVETVFADASKLLAERETGMATGDLYSWLFGTVRKFQKQHKIEIPQLSPISTPTAVNLLPGFPYKQTTMSIGGTAYYHDLGQFVADFENTFPLMRVVNLSVEPNRSPTANEREKLSFKMDLVALVKPNQP